MVLRLWFKRRKEVMEPPPKLMIVPDNGEVIVRVGLDTWSRLYDPKKGVKVSVEKGLSDGSITLEVRFAQQADKARGWTFDLSGLAPKEDYLKFLLNLLVRKRLKVIFLSSSEYDELTLMEKNVRVRMRVLRAIVEEVGDEVAKTAKMILERTSNLAGVPPIYKASLYELIEHLRDRRAGGATKEKDEKDKAVHLYGLRLLSAMGVAPSDLTEADLEVMKQYIDERARTLRGLLMDERMYAEELPAELIKNSILTYDQCYVAERIKQYIRGQSPYAFVLYGERGLGKTFTVRYVLEGDYCYTFIDKRTLRLKVIESGHPKIFVFDDWHYMCEFFLRGLITKQTFMEFINNVAESLRRREKVILVSDELPTAYIALLKNYGDVVGLANVLEEVTGLLYSEGRLGLKNPNVIELSLDVLDLLAFMKGDIRDKQMLAMLSGQNLRKLKKMLIVFGGIPHFKSDIRVFELWHALRGGSRGFQRVRRHIREMLDRVCGPCRDDVI